MNLDDFPHVLCFCPASRSSLVTLVLSTWTRVRRYVLTDDESHVSRLDGFSAVIVMDGFVTRPIVEQLAARLPVVVLAWNGFLEITRYRQTLAGIDVTYMTPEGSSASDAAASSGYSPLINGGCSFAGWRELQRDLRQFFIGDGAAYRLPRRSTRARRPLRVLIYAARSVRRPRVMRRTLESGLIRGKLVWAGNCYFDYHAIGLNAAEQKTIVTGVAAVNATPGAAQRWRASLELIQEWQTLAAAPRGAERAHETFYVTSTLLRWTVLSFLSASVTSSTWFFGRDNLGVGLECELPVYELVPHARVVFLDFGGKTSPAALYPRALQLLAGECYVIPIRLESGSDPRDEVRATVERIGGELTERPRLFFRDLERRRRALYRSLPPDGELRDVQERVWRDFALGPWS